MPGQTAGAASTISTLGGMAYIASSNDQSGATDGAAIAAVLAAGAVPVLTGTTYYFANQLAQALNGDNGIKCHYANAQLIYVGNPGGTALGTTPLTSPSQGAFYGDLDGGQIVYPKAKMTATSVGIYIAQPFTRRPITMGVGPDTASEGAAVAGARGLVLDGNTNPGPFKCASQVSGDWQIGIHVRTSHLLLEAAQGSFCQDGIVVDEDSLGSTDEPPCNITIIGEHSWGNSNSNIRVTRALSVTIVGGLAEGAGENPWRLYVDSSFSGFVDCINLSSFTLNKLAHFSTTGKVRFRDTQDAGGSDGFYDDLLYIGSPSGAPVVWDATLPPLYPA